jgi:hypothetical protein
LRNRSRSICRVAIRLLLDCQHCCPTLCHQELSLETYSRGTHQQYKRENGHGRRHPRRHSLLSRGHCEDDAGGRSLLYGWSGRHWRRGRDSFPSSACARPKKLNLWTTKDLATFSGGTNLYGYVVNDPVNGTFSPYPVLIFLVTRYARQSITVVTGLQRLVQGRQAKGLRCCAIRRGRPRVATWTATGLS